MSEDENKNPEDDMAELLRKLLSGEGGIDPSKFAGVAGLPNQPEQLRELFSQMQQAAQKSSTGIDWRSGEKQAEQVAEQQQRQLSSTESAEIKQAFHVASLWLDEKVTLSELSLESELLTRHSWVAATWPVWTEIAAPVAEAITKAIANVVEEQMPEELGGTLGNTEQIIRNVGGALFSMQLGQIVGNLSKSVISGGDIGILLLPAGHSALLPENIAEFGKDLGIPETEVGIYLATRELAHARLFRHAKWLALQTHTAITTYSRGIQIDTEKIAELAEEIDLSDTSRP